MLFHSLEDSERSEGYLSEGFDLLTVSSLSGDVLGGPRWFSAL